jgi:hypothetical protein
LSVDFEPYPSSPGAYSPAAQELAASLTSMIEASPDTMTGLRVDGSGTVTLSIPGHADAQATAATVQRQREQHAPPNTGTVPVTVQHVARSSAAMQAVRVDVEAQWTDGAFGDQIVGVGSDPSRGVVIVYATEDSLAARTSVKKRFGDAVVFRQMTVPTALETDRSRDTAAHFGGSGIYMWNPDHTQREGHCSTAFPVEKDGVRYLLTAGHCQPGGSDNRRSWASGFPYFSPVPPIGYYFGTRLTTTMSGTIANTTDGSQDRFGDWALLTGSTYSPSVYTCGNLTGSCSSATVGAVNWGNPVLGTGICTSGWSTGQICRQYVTDVDCTCVIGYTGGNARVAHLSVFRHDGDGDGEFDCGTVRGGDSGGAVYQSISGRPGYVRAMGIVTGGDNCTSFYTQLQGLRAFNSGYTMPTL